MTYKEAVDWMSCLRNVSESDVSNMLGTWYKGVKSDFDKAVDLAIEALEGKDTNVPSNVPDMNVGDMISRKQAIDVATSDGAYGYISAEELAKLPSAQPEPRSPLYYGDGYSEGKMVYDSAECPNCGYIYDEGNQVWGEPYCPHCGQALDWYMRGEQDDNRRV